MEVAGYKMPDQNTAVDFLEKILSRKCKTHRELPCEYLHLNPSEFSPRLCIQCMEQRDIPLNEVISVRLLLLATSNATFKSYPKFSDSSITQKIQDLKGSDDRISTDLSSYFNTLHSAVSQAIEKAKNAQKQKLTTLSNSYQDIFNSLSQISKIEQFQVIVKNTNDNEDKLKGFIKAQYSSMNNNTELINQKVLEYQNIQKSFSLTDANNKLSEIIRLIEGITLFPIITNNQDQLQQRMQQQQIQQQQPVQQEQRPIFLSLQQQQKEKQKEQQKPQNNLGVKSQSESQQQRLQNQPSSSSSKPAFDYLISLLQECKQKKITLLNNPLFFDDNFDFDLLNLNLNLNFDNPLFLDYFLLNYYEKWQKLSEDQRQKTLSYVKRQLNIKKE